MSFGDVPDLVGLPGIHIEVKRAEQVRLSEWMAQATRDSKRFRDGMPAVFHRRSCAVVRDNAPFGLYDALFRKNP